MASTVFLSYLSYLSSSSGGVAMGTSPDLSSIMDAGSAVQYLPGHLTKTEMFP